MVTDLNKILDKKDYSSEEDCKSLVFICANNHDFDLPFTMLLNYEVFDTYSEYWEKGKEIIKRNNNLLEELYRGVPEEEMLTFERQKFSRDEKLAMQKKSIKKHLKTVSKLSK